MSEFFAFLQLGFTHITDPNGLDHILFLIVLSAIYRLGDWRDLLVVVTAFTVGHSLTLALAVTELVAFPMSLIEFLIPVTIVATAIENLMLRRRPADSRRRTYRAILAGIFGLVHGAGFANYLNSLFVEDVTVPLLAFNLGLEFGQIVVLTVAAGVYFAFDSIVDRAGSGIRLGGTALQLRVFLVSCTTLLVAGAWALERTPW